MTTSLLAVRDALITRLAELYTGPDILVAYGPPGTRAAVIVSVGRSVTTLLPAAMGTARPGDARHTITVTYSGSTAGNEDQQAPITNRIIGMVDALDTDLRIVGRETLGLPIGTGLYRIVSAVITDIDLDMPDDPEALAKGRQAKAVVTLTVTAATP